MRSMRRAPCRSVARSVPLKYGSEIAVLPALQLNGSARKFIVRCLRNLVVESRDRTGASGNNLLAIFGHRCFERGDPILVPSFLGKQLVACAHCYLVPARKI